MWDSVYEQWTLGVSVSRCCGHDNFSKYDEKAEMRGTNYTKCHVRNEKSARQ